MNEVLDSVKIADLLVRKIAGDNHFSLEENRIFENWLSFSEENRNLWIQLSEGSLYDDFEQITHSTDCFKQWKRIERSIRPQKRYLALKRSSWAAAVVLFLFFSLYNLFKESDKIQDFYPSTVIHPGTQQAVLVLDDGRQIALNVKDTLFNIKASDIAITSGQVKYDTDRRTAVDSVPVYNTIIVPRGGIYSLILSDGSKVFLNSESELTYPMRFCGDVREVKLKGEAFFEVAHRLEQPFVVVAGEVETRVLGTVFNIMAYEDEPEIQTTLMEGRVVVSVRNTGLQKTLEPGYQAYWCHHADRLETRRTNVRLKALWRDGIIILDDDKLESVLRMLSRWYNVEYVFDSADEGRHTFTGRIDRNEDLESVLRNLTLLGGPHFQIKERMIHVLD